jgi:adenylate cyclase
LCGIYIRRRAGAEGDRAYAAGRSSSRMWMLPETSADTMNEPDGEVSWPELHRVRRALLVVDVVESVRLLQAFEADVIDRWRHFVGEVRDRVLPGRGGRLVKSLGDGMLIEFEEVTEAVATACELHARIGAYNEGREAAAEMHLRVGVHLADVVSDDLDVFGSGVNLAARLAGLAPPGSTVVSADVRDQLVPGLDPEAEDMGECQVKNFTGTVRAFRIRGEATEPSLPGFDTFWDERPTIAVLPFETRARDADSAIIGEILVDQVIRDLSVNSAWRVISRLSTMGMRGRHVGLPQLQQQLKLTYVTSGRCRVMGDTVQVSVELAHASSASVVWTGIVEGKKSDVLMVDGALGARIVEGITAAIFDFELKRSRSQPLPTLASHTLLFSAVALMHRLSKNDFDRARTLLEHLCERHPRAPEPHAWFAKWHVMKAVQGWSSDPDADAAAGHACAKRALDERSDHALGLAVDGLISGFLQHDLDLSQRRYEAAIAANPNEALAWLFMSALHAYRDRGPEAAQAARTALHLSPLDPIRYFYDSFAAHAMLAAGHLDEAIALAQRSLRSNTTHMPTHRSLAIALAMDGQMDAARKAVLELRRVDPKYSIATFQTRYSGRGTAFAERCADALRAAGLPTQ